MDRICVAFRQNGHRKEQKGNQRAWRLGGANRGLGPCGAGASN